MPTDVAAIRREHLEAFIEDQLARLEPASAANRYASIRPFFGWLVEEGEIRRVSDGAHAQADAPEYAPPILTDTEIGALLRACGGTGFDDRRDSALASCLSVDRRPP